MEVLKHILPNGERAKFTILSKMINSERFYYAHVISEDIMENRGMSEYEKELSLGIQIKDHKGHDIYYRDVERLKIDIKAKYGVEYLETETVVLR